MVAIAIAVNLGEVWNVHAQVVGLGERIIATGADLEIAILPAEAAFTSEIRLVVPSFGTFPIATSHETGRVVPVGVVPSGLELIFEIFVQETGDTFRTGPGARNPDGLLHATVVALGPNTWIIGFEDLFGGGDFDFNLHLLRRIFRDVNFLGVGMQHERVRRGVFIVIRLIALVGVVVRVRAVRILYCLTIKRAHIAALDAHQAEHDDHNHRPPSAHTLLYHPADRGPKNQQGAS
jgi:hypothetical protein